MTTKMPRPQIPERNSRHWLAGGRRRLLPNSLLAAGLTDHLQARYLQIAVLSGTNFFRFVGLAFLLLCRRSVGDRSRYGDRVADVFGEGHVFARVKLPMFVVSA